MNLNHFRRLEPKSADQNPKRRCSTAGAAALDLLADHWRRGCRGRGAGRVGFRVAATASVLSVMTRPQLSPEERAEGEHLGAVARAVSRQVANLDSVEAWWRWLGLARSLHPTRSRTSC